jgi:hypothetical protein
MLLLDSMFCLDQVKTYSQLGIRSGVSKKNELPEYMIFRGSKTQSKVL